MRSVGGKFTSLLPVAPEVLASVPSFILELIGRTRVILRGRGREKIHATLRQTLTMCTLFCT